MVARRAAVVAGRPVSRNSAVAIPADPRFGVGVCFALVGLVVVQDGMSHLAQLESHRVQELELERGDDIALGVRVLEPDGEFLRRRGRRRFARAAETRPNGRRVARLASGGSTCTSSEKERQIEKMATRFQRTSFDDLIIDQDLHDRLDVDRGEKAHFLSVGNVSNVLGPFDVGRCSLFSVHDSARYHDWFPFVLPASSRAQVEARVHLGHNPSPG